jgi:PAS domain S-box-containing protein
MNKYRYFFYNNLDLACFANLDGYFLEINSNFTEILGYTKEDLLNTRFLEFIHPEDIDATLLEMDKLSKGINTLDFINRYKSKSGEYIYLEWAASYDPETTLICAIARNITQRILFEKNEKLLIEELSRTNTKLKELNYILAHNIKGPISNVLALLKLLNDTNEAYLIKEIQNKLKITADSINDTLEQLLKITEIKQNAFKLTNISLNNIYNKVVSELSELIRTSGCVIEFDDKLKEIKGNEIFFQSIFYNLISNAIKYRDSKRKPSIKIIAQKTKNEVFLTFEDNGMGIDLKKYRDKIFGIKQTFHENPDAKGFGLYMTKSQVEAMGGKIEVESTLNIGTKFVITFKNM